MKKKLNTGFAEMINERSNEAKQSLGIGEQIFSINCDEIDTWEFRDRKKFELGNIEELAESIHLKGQAQPIIIVKASDVFKAKHSKDSKYIVIAGYRRWLACKQKGIKVKAVVSQMSFSDAIAILVAENEKESVSDYSKGMFYYQILKSEKITQQQLQQRLGIPITTIKRYLSFSRVPNEIWESVGDLSKVSARTSSEIASLCKKGKIYIEAFIKIADEIRKGYGEKKIKNSIMEIIENGNDKKKVESIVFKHNNNIIMTTKGHNIKLSDEVANHKKYNQILKSIEESIVKLL